MTESVIPKPGLWFEHALEWEVGPQHGSRPARYMVIRIAESGAAALPQVLYRRVDDSGESQPDRIDADLFEDIVLRWLTPEESEQADKQAQFR